MSKVLQPDFADPFAVLVLVVDHGEKQADADVAELLRRTNVTIRDVADSEAKSLGRRRPVGAQRVKAGEVAAIRFRGGAVHQAIKLGIDRWLCSGEIANHEVRYCRLMAEVPANRARISRRAPAHLIDGQPRPQFVGGGECSFVFHEEFGNVEPGALQRLR